MGTVSHGEHLKKQEILADSKAEASKTPVEVAEVIVEASAPNGKTLKMQVIAADPNGDAGQNTAEVAAETDPNGKAIKKNTTQTDDKQADPKGEAIEGRDDLHTKMENISKCRSNSRSHQ